MLTEKEKRVSHRFEGLHRGVHFRQSVLLFEAIGTYKLEAHLFLAHLSYQSRRMKRGGN
jgi:hypothetical protein